MLLPLLSLPLLSLSSAYAIDDPSPPNPAPPPLFDCHSVNSEAKCNAHDEPPYDDCGWCTATAKNLSWSGCVATWEIPSFPTGTFHCDKSDAAVSVAIKRRPEGFVPQPNRHCYVLCNFCCSGPGECFDDYHCDYSNKGSCPTGQCQAGSSCLSPQFQTSEDKCPSYCKWEDQPVPGGGHVFACVPDLPG